MAPNAVGAGRVRTMQIYYLHGARVRNNEGSCVKLEHLIHKSRVNMQSHKAHGGVGIKRTYDAQKAFEQDFKLIGRTINVIRYLLSFPLKDIESLRVNV